MSVFSRPIRVQAKYIIPLSIIVFLILSTIMLPGQRLPPLNQLFPATQQVNIVYFIQITPATLHHFPRLFIRNYDPQNINLLHYDVKIPHHEKNKSITLLRNSVKSFENTHILPSQLLVYDGISMVLNTLSAMTYALTLPNWHFFINLSGSDYPLTKPSLPRKLLYEAIPYDAIFFSSAGYHKWHRTFKQRAGNIQVDGMLSGHPTKGQLHQLNIRNPIINNISFVPMYTEAWVIASRPFVQYAAHSTQARNLLLALANMRGADEFFFSSLAFNNPVFNKSIVNNIFRTIVWEADGIHAGQHPYYLDELRNGTWRFLNLVSEAPHFHARKFEKAESGIMDLIDTLADGEQRVNRTTMLFRIWMRQLKIRYKEGLRKNLMLGRRSLELEGF